MTFQAALTDTGVRRHVRIRTRRPQTNGKVERFNQTLKREWAYVQPYTSNLERAQALANWLHHYNHHRYHRGAKGTQLARVTNVAACNS